MIHLLFSLIFAEMTLVFFLLFKTPLRKLIIMALDRIKRGRGPIVVKTVAGTVVIVLSSSLYSMKMIEKRSLDDGGINPTDQVLMANHLLEASLMGFSLFLACMIDRLHHYIRELRSLRKNIEAVKKQIRVLDEAKSSAAALLKIMENEMTNLRMKIEKLKSECETTKKELKTAEANVVAHKKQSEGFLIEYDRLHAENQTLRSQLKVLDQSLSRSDSKKNM